MKIFNQGAVLKMRSEWSNNYYIYMGISNITDDSETALCTCLVVNPTYGNDMYTAEIKGIVLIPINQLEPIDNVDWVDYINIAW